MLEVLFNKAAGYSLRQLFPYFMRKTIDTLLYTNLKNAMIDYDSDWPSWVGLAPLDEELMQLSVEHHDQFLTVVGTTTELSQFLASFERQEWAKVPRRIRKKNRRRFSKIEPRSAVWDRFNEKINSREGNSFLHLAVQRAQGRTRTKYVAEPGKEFYRISLDDGFNYIFDTKESAAAKADALGFLMFEVVQFEPCYNNLVHVRWAKVDE